VYPSCFSFPKGLLKQVQRLRSNSSALVFVFGFGATRRLYFSASEQLVGCSFSASEQLVGCSFVGFGATHLDIWGRLGRLEDDDKTLRATCFLTQLQTTVTVYLHWLLVGRFCYEIS